MQTISEQLPAQAQAGELDFEDRTYRKVIWRILPVLLLCYMAAYLDRVNIGFAKLDMLNELQFSNTVYALGASMFFWGYFLFEVPSNLLLHRFGARFWIARIMLSWAVISMAVAYTVPLAAFFHLESSTMFYVLRFLLGICEAGFFPGVILYLNYWFPTHRQSRVMSGFLLALPVSLTLGGILSGWLMNSMQGVHGLSGWQWMLLIEGIPSIIKSTGITNSLHIGLLTAIPYSVAVVAMLLNARHSNRTGERRLHAAIPAFIGGVGLILSAFFADNLVLSVLFLSVSASGILSLMPIFWTLPGTVLSGVAAAAGIGMINAIGNLSGFTGSMITAVAETLTGNINNGTYVLALCLLVSGGLILAIPASMLGRTAKHATTAAQLETA